jgi:ParB family transcriptional regulator, chromosome partitioning protein
MRNPFKGGLSSLIPHHDVEDADEAVDRLDEELSEEAAEPRVSRKRSGEKRVNVVSEDDEKQETKAPYVGAEEEKEEAAPAPQKPLVTPLTFDDTDSEPAEKPATPAAPAAKTHVKARAAEKAADKLSGTKLGAGWDKHEKDVRHIPMSDIRVNASQPRHSFDKTKMTELTNSIEQHGILQPLVVRQAEKGYELVAGERRLRAAKALGWDKVPCVVRRDVRSSASRLELALIENIQRQDLNPVEEALAYRQLNEEYGMTHEEIGRRVGRSRVGITNAIRVLQLPDEVQQGIIDGKISTGHAKAILMIPDAEKQVRFYSHLVEEGLTVRKAETRARRIQRTMQLDEPLRQKRKGRSAFEIKYSGKLEDHFGFDARVKFVDEMNRFEVIFRTYSQIEIEELLGRLLGTRSLPKKVDKDVIEAQAEEEE